MEALINYDKTEYNLLIINYITIKNKLMGEIYYMTNTQLFNLIIPFVSGGAMGAFISQSFTSYRGRRQPVGYSLETIPLFKKIDQ